MPTDQQFSPTDHGTSTNLITKHSPGTTIIYSVADPEFPVRGGGAIGGRLDLKRERFLLKMYVKTKELGPIGRGREPGTPPRSANDIDALQHLFFI